MPEESFATARELTELAEQALRVEWQSWDASLPPDAQGWPIGAVYVRESGAGSLVADAPLVQLRNALGVMASERVYVPQDHIFFEQATGTEIAARTQFQQLLGEALAGKFVALGTYVSSRLFRNMEEAIAVKRQFLMRGIRLFWLGRPKMDERDPSAWAMERQMEMADELHSRQTGWFVGRAKEYLSAAGYPQGPLPEGFIVAERGPSLQGGRRGRPIRWAFNEPLASHIKEGARRYLAGDAFKALERWSAASEFQGRTPAGVIMSVQWWHSTLTNPKYAGLHKVTRYQGYKPGKQSPKREHRTRHSELVACRLPALITPEDFYRIREVSLSRWKGPKWRPSYHEDLTAGILYDVDCGHRLHVKQRTLAGKPDRTRVQCSVAATHNPPAPSFVVDEAVSELDRLLASLTIDERALAEDITRAMQASEEPQVVPVVDPRIAELRAALANLADPALADMRQPLEAKLAILEARAKTSVPSRKAVTVESAVEALQHWTHIWESASLAEKNAVLRAAGLKVYVKRLPVVRGNKAGRPMSRLAAIRCEDPAIARALAAALGDEVIVKVEPTLDDPETLWRQAVWDEAETTYAKPLLFVHHRARPTRPSGADNSFRIAA